MQKNEYSPEYSPSGEAWRIAREGANHLPVVAAAIHDGHQVRPEVASRLALSEPERLREEDPFTAGWTDIVPIRVIGCSFVGGGLELRDRPDALLALQREDVLLLHGRRLRPLILRRDQRVDLHRRGPKRGIDVDEVGRRRVLEVDRLVVLEGIA